MKGRPSKQPISSHQARHQKHSRNIRDSQNARARRQTSYSSTRTRAPPSRRCASPFRRQTSKGSHHRRAGSRTRPIPSHKQCNSPRRETGANLKRSACVGHAGCLRRAPDWGMLQRLGRDPWDLWVRTRECQYVCWCTLGREEDVPGLHGTSLFFDVGISVTLAALRLRLRALAGLAAGRAQGGVRALPVPRKVMVSTEGLVAFFATEGLLAGVRPLVHAHVVRAREHCMREDVSNYVADTGRGQAHGGKYSHCPHILQG